ncbi:MAG: hypothetical protein KGL12_14105 [Rhodospirillales bacterium]|nr:hypothetical protein [Rhodospirillales bacterium]
MSHVNDPIATKLPETIEKVADAAKDAVNPGTFARVQHGAADLTEKLASAAQDSARRLREMDPQQTVDQLAERARKVRGRAGDFMGDMQERVAARPLTALAIAAGVGALAAMLFRARSRA